jgi:hypothetical protein
MGGRSHLPGGQRAAVGPATWYAEAAVSVVPLLLRRASRRRRATLPGLCRLRHPARVQRTPRSRGGLGIRFTGRSGFQPAMVRAHSRACVLSVMPGNSRRSSMAADSSPLCSNAARIATASASVTTNIAGAWGLALWPATGWRRGALSRGHSVSESDAATHQQSQV